MVGKEIKTEIISDKKPFIRSNGTDCCE